MLRSVLKLQMLYMLNHIMYFLQELTEKGNEDVYLYPLSNAQKIFYTSIFFSIATFSGIFSRLLFFIKKSIESLAVRNIAIVYKRSNKHIKDTD